MAALADLQPDRRAVLQLLVGRGRGYDQIAELLNLPEIVVRRRAHDAVTALAGGPGDVTDDQRALLCDYLVGELPASRRAEARTLLADDAGARRFARTAAARLNAIEGAQLPELPDEDEEVVEALDALDARRERQDELEHDSKRGAWLIVGAITIAVIAAVIALASIAGGGDDTSADGIDTGQTTAETTASGTTPQALYVQLTSPTGGAAKGQAGLKTNGSGATVLALQATGIAPTHRNADGSFTSYALWLDGPTVDPLRLGFYTQNKNNAGSTTPTTPGALDIGAILDGSKDGAVAVDQSDLEKYTTLILSRETLQSTKDDPKQPGTIVLSGKLSVLQ